MRKPYDYRIHDSISILDVELPLHIHNLYERELEAIYKNESMSSQDRENGMDKLREYMTEMVRTLSSLNSRIEQGFRTYIEGKEAYLTKIHNQICTVQRLAELLDIVKATESDSLEKTGLTLSQFTAMKTKSKELELQAANLRKQLDSVTEEREQLDGTLKNVVNKIASSEIELQF